MTSIRRPSSPVQPVVARQTPQVETKAPTMPARAASGFDPLSKVRRLVELFHNIQNPDKAIDTAIDRATANSDWFSAPLEVKGIDGASDVRQGGIGDCYMVATAASIAHQHPDVIRRNMTENADGTVTFRLFKRRPDGRFGDSLQPELVTVTRELPLKKDGTPAFGSSSQHEAWFPLLEKAFAQMNGGLKAIGHGGGVAFAQEALLGSPATNSKITGQDPRALFSRLQTELAQGRIIGVSTQGEAEGRAPFQKLLDVFRATVRGLVPNHAYSVWGTQEVNGKQYVLLRNPWANTEPGSLGPIGSFAVDGKNDGVFAYPMEEFVKRFDWMTSAAP